MRYFFLFALFFSNVEAVYSPSTDTYTVDSSGSVQTPYGSNSEHNQKNTNQTGEKR